MGVTLEEAARFRLDSSLHQPLQKLLDRSVTCYKLRHREMRCQFIQPVNENLIVSDFDLQSAMPISTVFF